MPKSKKIDCHTMHFFDPDIIRVQYNKTPTLHEIQLSIEEFGRIWSPNTTAFLLADVSYMKDMGPESRKAAADWIRGRNAPTYIANIGANWTMHLVGKLASNALKLFNSKIDFEYFNNEDEGLAWLRSKGARG